jgi:hypothetical protein
MIAVGFFYVAPRSRSLCFAFRSHDPPAAKKRGRGLARPNSPSVTRPSHRARCGQKTFFTPEDAGGSYARQLLLPLGDVA